MDDKTNAEKNTLIHLFSQHRGQWNGLPFAEGVTADMFHRNLHRLAKWKDWKHADDEVS